MVFLGKFKFLLKAIGSDPLGGNNIVRSIYLIGFALIYFMVSTLIVSKIHDDINVALGAVPIFFGLTLVIFIFCHLGIKREHMNSLLGDLHDIVEKSMKIEFLSNSNIFPILLSDLIYFSGARLKLNTAIYARAEQRNNFATKIILKGLVPIPIAFLSPFVLAAYHWCLGKYTIDSWFFLYPVW